MPSPNVIAYRNESGTEVFSIDQSGNVTAAGTISTTGTDDFGTLGLKADVIAESTAAAGVTVDGLLVKDNAVGSAAAPATTVTATTLVSDTVSEKTAASGVTIDSLLIKDGGIAPAYVTGGVGASTAAAGSTYSDAGQLPAGTGLIYPVTGADDTTGVQLSGADKVTGRTVLIGNLVSNKILKVYAPGGGTINGAAADAAFSSASGKGVIITCLSGAGNTWMAW